MSEKNNQKFSDDPKEVVDLENEHVSSSTSLDDEQRVKMLSPAMLVAKRFIRNRLAIAGLIIILVMFLFSFVGGALHPYSETKIFYKKEITSSIYASATINENFYEDIKDGKTFTSLNKAAFALALKDKQTSFTTPIDGVDTIFTIETISADTHLIYGSQRIGKVDIILDSYFFVNESDNAFSASFEKMVIETIEKKGTFFEYEDEEYFIDLKRRECIIYEGEEYGILSKNIYSFYNQNDEQGYDFKALSERAINKGETGFVYQDTQYNIEYEDNIKTIHKVENGQSSPYVNIANIIITPVSSDIFLSIDFRYAIEEAMLQGDKSFMFQDKDGNDVEYLVERKDREYVIRTDKMTDLIDTYASPSKEHPLGTDGSGMDLLVRLMYGGRVSLTIGFVVVLIEMVIGIVLGGLSGYFGGWIDTLLMRLVEIFNCIPTMPLYIILGAALDTMKLEPAVRIYLLMVILGVTGWPGIARVVRGQILSLREQEFMVANEATGLSVTRRIFKHLVPNVIPQLIVFATMSLGGIILTEATLSFLNLGVKYPYASWGNIVNSVNDSYVLQNYWFVWIPAGMLILITVLGFNFVGDGLRDAFDPKMKR